MLSALEHLTRTGFYMPFAFLHPAWRVLVLTAATVTFLIAGTYSIQGQSPDDHGNTPATATPINLGDSVVGRIDPGDDMDVFEIDLSQASGVTDVWAYTTGEVDTVGGLYDSEGALLLFNDDGYIRGFNDTGYIRNSYRNFSLRRLVPPGTYYVVIVSWRPNPGDYTLHTSAVTDPGNSVDTAESLSLGSRGGGTLIEEDEEEYWRLDFPTDTYVIIDAVTSSKVSLDAEVLDVSGTRLRENIYSLDDYYSYLSGDGLTIRERFSPGTYYIRVKLAGRPEPRPVPYTITASVDVEVTQFSAECNAKTQALNNPSISDPLFGCQWHLESNEFVHINAESAWEAGALGEGVNVALVDQGFDYLHEDLVDNVDVARNHDYNGEGEIYNRLRHHGTHVAGIIAARDNSVGLRGVAPRATLYGYNLFDGYPSLSERLDAMTRNAEVTAVSNNSWGNRDSVRAKRAATFWETAVETGLNTGYDGKGTFYVFSAGNGHLLGDDSNLDEYANFYGVTAACSVQGWGARAPYSEMGANLWVCAPSNERPGVFGLAGRFGIVTTEHSDNYVHDFGGTSTAAPIVSGVAALMRSVNPDLTWRDLKLILADSAQRNDPSNSGWEEGARKYRADSALDQYHFNHEYGFGLVDAGAAVELANEWTNVPEMQIEGVSSGNLGVTIPDAQLDGSPTTVSSSLTLEGGIGFVEFVEVNIELRHRSFRDLDIELVSPSGAVSRLAVPHDTSTDLFTYTDFISLYGSFRFGSARHLGEDPNGEWTLRITDRIHAGEGTLESWDISVYGHAPEPDAPAVSSVSPKPGALDVTWTAPADTSDFEVTAYDLRVKRSEDSPEHIAHWAIFRDAWTLSDGGDLEFEATGLIGGTSYDVQVRAVNRWGPGTWSDPASGTPENVLPTFSEAGTTRSVEENTPAGGGVGDPVTAVDDGTLSYTIGDPDAALFDIASSTGQIIVGSGTRLDYESGLTEFTVTVTATDDFLASTSTTVTINVVDVSLGQIGDTYDADRNEMIDRSEVLEAVNDYLDGLISREDVLEIIALYLFG